MTGEGGGLGETYKRKCNGGIHAVVGCLLQYIKDSNIFLILVLD